METIVDTRFDQLSMRNPTDHLAFLKHLCFFYANEIMMLENCTKSHMFGIRLALKKFFFKLTTSRTDKNR